MAMRMARTGTITVTEPRFLTHGYGRTVTDARVRTPGYLRTSTDARSPLRRGQAGVQRRSGAASSASR